MSEDEKDITQRRKQLLIDYRVTFNSESGQRVLKDLEDFSGYNHPCFYRGESDMTVFTLGQRNVVLRVKSFLDIDPEQKLQEEVIKE